jgi:hypothetical protein
MNITEIETTTSLLGSIDLVLSCNSILVYNSESMPKLSVDNVINVYDNLIKGTVYNNKYMILKRRTEVNIDFKYDYNEAINQGLVSGFDVIIYLNSTNTIPIGFTELQSPVGMFSNVNINLGLVPSLNSEPSNLKITFTLDEITESLYSLKDLTTTRNDLYQYTTANSILDIKDRVYEPYTNNINCLQSDTRRILYLNDRVINNKNGVLELRRLNILRDKEVDPFRVNYQTFSINQYGNDIALYAWSKTEKDDETGYKIDYCINSLTKSNKFGNLQQYVNTKDNDGSCTIPDITNEQNEVANDVNILYVTGKYLVCEGIFNDGTKKLSVLDTDKENPHWLNLPEDFVCFTEWENIPKPIQLKYKKINFSVDSKKEILEKYPDLYSTYLDTMNSSSFSLKRKIGNWYLIQKNTNNGSIYVLAGKSSTIYTVESDLEKIIVVNDNTVLLKENDYYLMYTGNSKTWYTERYRSFFKDSSFINYHGIQFASTGDTSSGELSDTTYKNYYDKEYIKIIPKNESIYNTILNQYRRNYYPLSIDKIPNIIGAFRGIIFYIEDGKINYL